MREPSWIPAFRLAELAVGDARIVQHQRQRIAVFRVGEAELHAIDDRCPHEGYPLVRGHVKECVVTCLWHNFKFDLRDGRCVMGDESVQVFPLRIVDGVVELDVRDPELAEALPERLASLERAVLDGKIGQAARDVVRLLQLGVTPARIALEAARLDAAYAEYGTTHATPVAIDGLRLARRREGVDAALPLVQAFDVAAENHRRRPRRPVADPIDPGADPIAAGARLRDAVEAEDAALAEGLLRGAIARGVDLRTIEGWFVRLCAEHFLDFGHPLIYTFKIFDLLAEVGWEHADALLTALLYNIVVATREDLLPEWQWFRARVAEASPRLDGWVARSREGRSDDPSDPRSHDRSDDPVDPRDHDRRVDRSAPHNHDRRDPPNDAPLRDLEVALTDGTRDAWFAALTDAWERGAPPQAIADALILAASERLLRFDPRVDARVDVQEGWLDVTHRLTFAAAVREALVRHPGPDALRLVLQAARFIRAAAPLDAPIERRPRVRPASGDAATLSAIDAAIRAHRADEAFAGAAAYLAAEGPADDLERVLEDIFLDDAAVRPIFVAHQIKTTRVAFEEYARLPAGVDRARPILALVHFLAGPLRERSVRRVVHEAIRFVVDGKVPRTLT
ncbi:MAG: Rieske (2Fe-2S) protein [Nannocystaceae bacterium]